VALLQRHLLAGRAVRVRQTARALHEQQPGEPASAGLAATRLRAGPRCRHGSRDCCSRHHPAAHSTACPARTPRRAAPQLRDWAELDKLASLPSLREVLFLGNPLYDGLDKAAARLQVLKRLPRLDKVDNEVVTDNDREAAGRA
jgi:hypothetical protein